MKNTFKLFVTLFLLAVTLNQGMAQVFPTFNMTATNVRFAPGPNGADSVVIFDIFCQHTNLGVSDPFEYAACQFSMYYNKAIQAPGASLNFIRVSSQIGGTGLVAPTTQVDSTFGGPSNPRGLLKTSGNIPVPSANYFINSVFPGTRILTMRVRTTAHQFPVVPLGLAFKLGPAPNTFISYLLPYPPNQDTDLNPNQFAQNLMDTVNNIYSVVSNEPLPVELASFVANVNKNNVTLNWSTTQEDNNQGFDIERTVVGSEDWTKVGNVAGNGTTNETKNYSFSERAATGHYNYRLKQIDFNGNYEYHSLSNEVVVGVPTVYAISQNYPNPFNPSTKIDFELPYDGKVSILLYDISGREVGKLVNEVLTAGYHTVQFNGSNLSSGMYFYRINATGGSQNFVSTKKMVLIK